jgi:peptidoglycan/xylan/chitin deacetylase (PgdA/CDA1 family)
MEKQNDKISVSNWFGDKQWVYSITFDEALSELHLFTIPILEKYGVPGHVEVVVGQMGQERHLLQSSYNGMHHMGVPELRDLLKRGWGVGTHSWSHTYLNLANLDRELTGSKHVLEDAIGVPVTVYCSPGGNFNMSEEILAQCRVDGFLGAMSLYEALNRPDDVDLLWLNRTFLHDNGPDTFDCEFDPFRKIMHAQRDHGWIIDYLHCPLEKPVHPRKDCSVAHLQERIETLVNVGGDDVWLAKVEDPMDYRYTRRHVCVDLVGERQYHLSTPGLPPSVQNHWLTFALPTGTGHVEVGGKEAKIYLKNGKKLVDIDLNRETVLKVFPG